MKGYNICLICLFIFIHLWILLDYGGVHTCTVWAGLSDFTLWFKSSASGWSGKKMVVSVQAKLNQCPVDL